MLKSMTAYGNASVETKIGRVFIEIQSVNRKFLEITVALPREFSHFEIDIKKWVALHLGRGQINIRIEVSFENEVPFIIRPNLALARQLKTAWKEIAKELGEDSQDFQLSLIREEERLFFYEENRAEEGQYRQIFKETLEIALKGFLLMKRQEGAVLQEDIFDRMQKIRNFIGLIALKVPNATKKYREKLMARLEELLPGHIENEERVLREVALYAEKIDIAEEITRFYSHLAHFEGQIKTSTISLGKTLEFILQELNREVNTIGSKSSDIEISKSVIDIKSELERIREQIQNVE